MHDKETLKRQDLWFLSLLTAWSLFFLLFFIMSMVTATVWPFNNVVRPDDPERITRAMNPTIYYWALIMYFTLFITPWLSLFLALYKGRPRFFTGNVTITQAANGHVLLTFGHIPLWASVWLEWHLTYRQGFRRDGRRVFGVDLTIAPDFIRGNIRLRAGSDNNTGTYLLSASASGDKFLMKFAEEVGCSVPPAIAGPAV